MKRIVVVLAACSAAKPAPPVRPMTTAEWIRRCADRVEVARLVVARVDKTFGDAEITVDSSPWNPRVRFDLSIKPDGYFGAQVQHGSFPCLDFDPTPTVPWKHGGHDIVLSRMRRLEGDEAWVEGNRVAPATAAVFGREMERALEACLLDARGVPLGKPPTDFTCGDTVDKCPDEPTEGDDGCPSR